MTDSCKSDSTFFLFISLPAKKSDIKRFIRDLKSSMKDLRMTLVVSEVGVVGSWDGWYDTT